MVDELIEQHMKGPVGRMGDMFPEGGTRPEYSEPDPTLVGLYLNVCDRIFGGGKNKVVDEGRRDFLGKTLAMAAITPVITNPFLRRIIPKPDTGDANSNGITGSVVDGKSAKGKGNRGNNLDSANPADNLTDEEFEKKLQNIKDELEAAGRNDSGDEIVEEDSHSEEKLSYLGKGVMGVMLVHFATTVGQIAKSKGEKTFNEFSAARSIGLAYTCDFILQKYGNEADKHFGHEIIHELTGGTPPINLILTGALSVLTNITALMENKIIEQLNLDEERIGTDKPKRGFIERTKSLLGREREQELVDEGEKQFNFFESVSTEDDDRSTIDYSSADLRKVVTEKIQKFNVEDEEERVHQQEELREDLERLNRFYKDMLVSTTSRGMGMIGALSPIFTTYLGADLGNQLGNELLDIATKKKMIENMLENLNGLNVSKDLETAMEIIEATSAVETSINMNKLGGLRGAIMFYAANASGLIGIGDPPNIFAITEALERDFLPEYIKKSQGEGIIATFASGLTASGWSLKESFGINPLTNPRFVSEFGKGIGIGLGKVGEGLINPLTTIKEIMRGTTVVDIEDFRVVKFSDIEHHDAFRSLYKGDGSVISLDTLLKHLSKEVMPSEEKASIRAEIEQLSYNLKESTAVDITKLKGVVTEYEFLTFLESTDPSSISSYDDLIEKAKLYRDENPELEFDLGQFIREVLELSPDESRSDALVREFFAKVKITDSRSFVMPGYVVTNSLKALGHTLQDGVVNVFSTVKGAVKDPRELVDKAVFLETDEHHEAGLTIFDRLVEGQEISYEEFIQFLQGFNLASGNTDIIQSIMSFTVMTGTNEDVPSGAEMTTISKYMSEFIVSLGEHRNEKGMLKVLSKVNKFFEDYKEVLIAKFSNGSGKEPIDYSTIKPELVDTLLKMLDEGVANPELTKVLGLSYDDLNVVDRQALRDAIVKMGGFNVEESEIAEGLSHSAKEVLYALLTQLSHVGAMIESAKSVFGSVDEAMGDLEPKAKLMLKLNLSTVLSGGVSMFADNVAAFLFGIATNDKIVEDYIESVGGLPGGEKQAKELKLEGFMLSLWTAIMAGSLFKSGNGPNFSLLNQHPQIEIGMKELSGDYENDNLIKEFTLDDSDTVESALEKLKKLGMTKEAAQNWYQENAASIKDKQVVLKPKVLLTPSGGLNTTQTPVDFIESFKMSKYWLWRIILPILALRTGMVYKKASTE
ncbi:MAG TPA: hypothetical protein PK863_03050 [Candidatus Dojkabacteria bacterium]|nr:hypothetical protein [Candidatus Dojkabacteria bacterium]HRP51394.1 hypothetical protein [Candidatus Dojkabacteria bacterium]